MVSEADDARIREIVGMRPRRRRRAAVASPPMASFHDLLPPEIAAKHRNRLDLPRDELLEIIEEQTAIIRSLVDEEDDEGHRPPQPPPTGPPVSLRVFVEFTEGNPMTTVSITDAEQVDLHVQEDDTAGNPVSTEEGVCSWVVDGDTIIAVTPSADGFSCTARPVGPAGTGIVTPSVQLPDVTDPNTQAVTPGAVLTGQPVPITVTGTNVPAALAVSADAPVPLTPA